ncbi:S8 family serine peptidase [Allokutzneria sp. NRRL B-24872]|uniref:S8 family serine peptidase n=1 Tax=Allokutzneria sp. NRRL B-24872 TaxID=1137961 RepID=UPI000A3A171B|nr:S8 family serine peptidase [Allokutzneria sp. NRRL B-24872]
MMTAGATALLLAMGVVSPAQAQGKADPGRLNDTSAAQIAELQRIKGSLSKAESKVDSRLVVENRIRRGALTANLPHLNTGVAVTDADTVLVDIRADKVTDLLTGAIRKAGGAIRHTSAQTRTVRAELPLGAVNGIAAREDVVLIDAASDAMTSRATSPGELKTSTAKGESKEARANRLAEQAKAAVRNRAAALTSQGDRAHAADTARSQYKISGLGVKLCALSDGIDSLAALQSAGELPQVDVLAGQEGSGDEGSAMLEILHDVAPGAELGFATAFNGDASFADNIRALRFEKKCDVIVDDVLYFNESPFQDGIIAQAVNDVTKDGGLFFSSAGNEGNVADGSAGHWEGNFVDSGKSVGRYAGSAHDFDATAAGTQIVNPLSANSRGIPVLLWWNDALGRSTNDYDLYLLDGSGNVVGFSQNVQTGQADPYERVNPSAGGLNVAVVKFRGDDKYLSLSALRGRFRDSGDLKGFNTPGVTRGHSAAKDAFSVAATPAAGAWTGSQEPGDPANPAGPYPDTFSGASKLERFSSDGPRRVFFNADGTPVASPAGEVRQKPDITAADGVATKTPGFSPFFGTSAAAPHAAAIAGLVLSGNPGMSTADVRDALTRTALDIAAPGVDNRAGAGVVMADKVLAYTGASPQPLAKAESPTVVPTTGSPYLKPGNTAEVKLPVRNGGDGTASSVSVVLTSPTPGVTVGPRSKSYGTVEPGQTALNSFTLTVPASHQVGVPVTLEAKVSFAGSLSPTTQKFAIPVGQPSSETKTFSYTGAPVAIPDGNSEGVSVQLPVSGVGLPSKLAFSVDGATCSATEGSTTVGIDHTYASDLVGTLTSPGGVTATLFQRNGGNGNNLCQVVFDDTAAQPFSSVTQTQAPFTGTWRPTTALSALAKSSADGTWTFKAVDAVSSDKGSIRSISLKLNGYVN